MDWFERLTGFREGDYQSTRARLAVEGDRLRSLVNGRSYGIGSLELVSLVALRVRAVAAGATLGRLTVRNIAGDVRELHRSAPYAGALFQVASQFNLLEMTSPHVTPERGVTRYQSDPTQGPACAIAAGAATIWRNYFAPVGDRNGQTAGRQIDALADLGAALAAALGRPVGSLWEMRNGYALCTASGLAAIGEYLRGASDAQVDFLRGRLRIGLHWDVEVTDGDDPRRPNVSQAFCSALPVSYCSLPDADWRPFAQLVLEAAYEATLWAGVLNARRGASNIVMLTRLGGGAFGNDPSWIDAAMERSLGLVAGACLDIRLVSRGGAPP